MDLNCVEETTQTMEQPLESSQSNVVSQISRENGDSDGEDDEGMPIDKQALIESLVAMGFSIEWASLAGNDPDASRSASAAIAWIIERVESARGNSADQDENDEDESLQDDEEGDDGEDCTGESLVNGGQKVYDSFATHTEGTLSVDEEVVKTTEAGIISYSVEVDGAWNSDTNYGPILAGYHSARRKYDSDKQEVLQQVTDLESREMPQIVACCQYTLITFYARAVLLYTISSINTKPVSIYEETLLTRSSWESLYRAMYQSYKHHVSAIAQPDRLLPSIERYNNNGEIRDRVPQYFPFISTVNEVIPSLSEALAALESLTLPHFSNDMCAEDSSIQGIGRLQTFLRYLVKSNTQSSNLLLEYIVTRASKELILAKTTAGRSSDWITAVANRDEKLYATCTSPEILAIFNHFLLRIILSSGLREPQSQLAIVSAFPVKTLTDLIRVGLAPSSNPSIRFCCLDVVSLIFAVVAQLDGTVAKQYASAIEPRHILKLFSGRFRQESHSHTQFSKLTRLIALLLCQYLRLVRIAEEKEDMSIVGLENLTQYQNESAHLALQLKRNKSQPAINTCAITISHSAAKSLNLSWNVQPEQVPAALTSLTLHVNEISLFHRSTSKRTFTKLSPSGFIEVDGLVPDSLYIVALQPQGSSNVTSDLYQIHVPSEPETGMRLDATHSAAPLVVLSNGLTVRNTVKKKWSTCRSALKMVSGFHRWDLQIDRCVSKNIFIGVVTADAKMDGYVGSDRHGWAFLSNKAIWHGKAKTKTYGELFRTGDIITTVLDLDRGTLSFALNGRDMGIAAEGLVGPLYAALSLYNDDDQVTLLEHNPSTSSGDEWSGGSAERVLERLVMLQQSLASIRLGYSSDQDDIDTKTGMKAVKNEVDLRGKLLSSGMTSRSFLSGNDFITLVRSPELCQEFTAGQLSLGDQVGTPCGRGMVAGVAGSKLYIQLESGDEYYSLYRELFRNLWITCGIHLVSRASEVKAPRDDWRFNWVHFINKEASLAFGCNISSSWTLEQDKYLVAWMNVVSDSSRCHPLDLPLWVFMESIMSLLDQSTTIATAVTGDMNKKSDEFMLFFKTQTLDIVARRIVVILHVNDLIGSLLPVCNLDDGLGGHDDCSSMLGGHKHLILSSVRDQVIAKIGKSLVSAKIQSLDDSESALTLHIQSPARMSASMGSAIVNTQTSEEQSYSSNLLSVDRRWNLIAAFQCSYLGQMFRWFEKLSQSQFTFQPVLPHHNVYCSSNWEIALRQVYADKGLLLSTSENDRPVPFTIALKEEDEINANSSKSSSGLIAILEQKHVSNGSVSNWTVFAEFVRVATEEINSLLESIYSAALSTNEGSLEAAIESIRANSLVVEALTALGVGEINLLCQIFRAAGILIGLAERAGIKPSLRLPSLFQHILAPGKDEDFEKCHGIWQIALQNKALCCTLVFALALRNGVLAVLPDIGLRLRSIDDFASD